VPYLLNIGSGVRVIALEVARYADRLTIE
jgi:hypothetical protein